MPRRTHPKSEAGLTRLALVLALIGLVLGIAAGVLSLGVIERAEAGDDCTWGASSILYEGGQVVAGPDVTGCVP